MKKNHLINMFRIVNQNNNKTKFNETFDYNKNTHIHFEKRNKNQDNKKQIINNKNNTNNHMDMSNKINNIIIENKVKKNEKIPDDFKNLKILGNNETIFDKNQHSNSTISQLSVFQSLKNGRKNSNISFGFESLFSLSEEEIKIKKEIDPESFKKFCKKINDILNLNYNKY